jgi:hypothetical protein
LVSSDWPVGQSLARVLPVPACNLLRDYGDGWKTKYTGHKETVAQKMEEQIRELENGQKDKVKQIREVEKKSTLFEDRCLIQEDKLKERELQLQELIEERRQVYLLPFPSLFVSVFYIFNLSCATLTGKNETRGTKRERKSEDASSAAGNRQREGCA